MFVKSELKWYLSEENRVKFVAISWVHLCTKALFQWDSQKLFRWKILIASGLLGYPWQRIRRSGFIRIPLHCKCGSATICNYYRSVTVSWLELVSNTSQNTVSCAQALSEIKYQLNISILGLIFTGWKLSCKLPRNPRSILIRSCHSWSYMPCPSQSSRFNHPDYIRWRVETMKFLIVEPSPLPTPLLYIYI